MLLQTALVKGVQIIKMILAVDVGNTNIVIGCIEGDEILFNERVSTNHKATDLEYAIKIKNIFEIHDIDLGKIEGAVMSSVVPSITEAIEQAVKKLINSQPLVVGSGIKTGLRIKIPNPQQVGADRIVDAVAAYEIYGGPVLVLDYGTATTYDLVDEKGTFIGGITAPGIAISAKALWEDAAKLPKIEIAKPENVIGNDTITSMQSGLVYGQIGQAEYLIKKVKEEAGLENIKVVATGGLGRLISENTDAIDIYDANLTLKGIYLVYKKQNRRTK